jgi:hypothetical protein
VSRAYSQRLQLAVKSLEDGDIVVKQHCDAIAVSGPATASGNGSFFARDFQLATALVLQDLQTMIIYNPTDGRQPLVAVLAPVQCSFPASIPLLVNREHNGPFL